MNKRIMSHDNSRCLEMTGKVFMSSLSSKFVIPFPRNAAFDALKIYTVALEKNIVRKGEIACNKQFLLFSQCFLHYMAHCFSF